MADTQFINPPFLDEKSDLGFGNVVARESRERLLNRDGSFNVERRGFNWFCSVSPYHTLLTMTWPRFLALLIFAYIATNIVFGELYYLCGPDALAGDIQDISNHGLLRAFSLAYRLLQPLVTDRLRPLALLQIFWLQSKRC